MQRIPIDEFFLCDIDKHFHLFHVTVADPDSGDSSRLYPNERYSPSVTPQSNSMPTKFLLSAPNEVFT